MRSMLTLFFLSTLLLSCGGNGGGKDEDKPKEPAAKPVSCEALATQRTIANDNSVSNAKTWSAKNGSPNLNILVRGDSTQQTTCPQGDGWAAVELLDSAQASCGQGTAQTQGLRLVCSTVSAAAGCLKEEEFIKRFAKQENRCNQTLPATLTKITP